MNAYISIVWTAATCNFLRSAPVPAAPPRRGVRGRDSLEHYRLAAKRPGAVGEGGGAHANCAAGEANRRKEASERGAREKSVS